MLRAIQMGLSVADLELLTFGMLLDLITTWNNNNSNEDEEEVREATQADFDRL